jgi:hypothetical protein
MKSIVKIHCLIGFLAVPFSAVAAPAVGLILTNDECLFQFCPPTHPPPATTVASGSAFQIFVIAVDSASLLDPNYEGTVIFVSTDSLASLPPGYTSVSSDQGRKGFIAILRTPGSQMITVSDSTGNLYRRRSSLRLQSEGHAEPGEGRSRRGKNDRGEPDFSAWRRPIWPAKSSSGISRDSPNPRTRSGGASVGFAAGREGAERGFRTQRGLDGQAVVP